MPQPNSLFSNMYHTKVFVENVNYNYESIHACKNEFVLFQGDTHKYTKKIKFYDASRFKVHGKLQLSVNVLKHFLFENELVGCHKSP